MKSALKYDRECLINYIFTAQLHEHEISSLLGQTLWKNFYWVDLWNYLKNAQVYFKLLIIKSFYNFAKEWVTLYNINIEKNCKVKIAS